MTDLECEEQIKKSQLVIGFYNSKLSALAYASSFNKYKEIMDSLMSLVYASQEATNKLDETLKAGRCTKDEFREGLLDMIKNYIQQVKALYNKYNKGANK
jgi:hypothetical protein